MSVESENIFRQSFRNWNDRTTSINNNNNTNTNRPILSEWTDYFKTGANDLYQRLPTSIQDLNNPNSTQQQEPSWFQLSRLERLIGFGCCLSASVLCFVICFFMFPVLALRPRKFGLLWTGGSVLFVISFGVLQGPYNYIRHLLSKDRIVFTTVFFTSIFLTIYSSVVLKSSLLTIFTSIIEIFAIAYYTISYFPFGATTLTFFTSYISGYIFGLIGGIL
ncbi:SFT2 [Candida jiufengensis]|uniref:SFT2 n=1 Tax=Candida jiufengensis TaxID=497108 RepID=UPI002224BEDB|nr:SFT2 [Candida jiufengensis]KAI5951046.1 SFT2 [Candida jiufengensis]